MSPKEIYERLSRTPRSSAQKVARWLNEGNTLESFLARLDPPRGEPATVPFVTPACQEYPDKIKQLYDPPLTLFHRGLPLWKLSKTIVGVVGSRKASRFGLSLAHKLGQTLSRQQISVCSGLALGIDGASHRGVLDEIRRNSSAAPPVAILGHGWKHIHPKSHLNLAGDIVKNGVILTEYPPNFPGARWSFPARNRIIAALSDHLVVVEAGLKSGSLYTAEFALDLGRTVWIIPNAPGRPNSAGVLGLWRAGAEVVWDIDEFVNEVTSCNNTEQRNSSDLESISEENRKLLRILIEVDCQMNEFCIQANIGPQELAYRLTEMELDGLIRRTHNGAWEILRWDLIRYL